MLKSLRPMRSNWQKISAFTLVCLAPTVECRTRRTCPATALMPKSFLALTTTKVRRKRRQNSSSLLTTPQPVGVEPDPAGGSQTRRRLPRQHPLPPAHQQGRLSRSLSPPLLEVAQHLEEVRRWAAARLPAVADLPAVAALWVLAQVRALDLDPARAPVLALALEAARAAGRAPVRHPANPQRRLQLVPLGVIRELLPRGEPQQGV